jgi:hypothetical protein
MAYVHYLIREYRDVVERENEWAQRKTALRTALLDALVESGRHRIDTEHGTAIRTTRVNLLPRRESVLALLKAEDLFPFTRFWPRQVQHVLVPRYGRDPLLELFDARTSPLLVVKAPDGRDVSG